MSLWIILAVALGGAIGSVARFGATQLTAKLTSHPFPFATLAVNFFGCLAIGLWLGYLLKTQQLSGDRAITGSIRLWDAALRVGICGGLTTFSSFSAESIQLFHNQQFGLAFLNTLGSLVIGLAATWFGLKWMAGY